MSTDVSQVMRVVDRCLDTTEPQSNNVPGVAAAAARAKTDPDLHRAISRLLAADENCARSSGRRALAMLRELASREDPPGLSEHCDGASPLRQMLRSCEAASRTAGEADHRTAAALAEMYFTAIMVERSSLGADHSRRLRNSVAHNDIAAARNLFYYYAAPPQEAVNSTESSGRSDVPGCVQCGRMGDD